MKKSILVLAALAGLSFSASALAQVAPFEIAGAVISEDCQSVELTLVSSAPLDVTLEPVVYARQPEYWLHYVRAEYNPLADECLGDCYAKHRLPLNAKGTMGIQIVDEAFKANVQLTTQWQACRK